MYVIKWGRRETASAVDHWWMGVKCTYTHFQFVTDINEAATYENRAQAEEYVKFLKENMDVAEYTILELTIEEK
jgi:hypothetical protein